MGYIIGGDKRTALIKTSGTSEEITVPNSKPVRTYRNTRTAMQKTGQADITRTAPLFNDPRYTSSTLAINIGVAFQGDLN